MDLSEYETWLRRQEMAPRSIQARSLGARLMLQAVGDPAAASTEQIIDWMQTVQPGWSRITYRAHAVSFFTWAQQAGLRLDNPAASIRRPRTPRPAPRPIRANELAVALLIAPPRERTMILLGAYAGLRLHEIAKVRGQDLQDGCLYVTGKGSRDAAVPLHPLLLAEADRYPTGGWWFPSPLRPGQPMTPTSTYSAIRRVLQQAGSEASPHKLRHWYGSNVLRAAGGNVRTAQELLRHASLTSTMMYTEITGEERRAAILALPAVAA